MNPETRKELRGQIDNLDHQIIELLLKRIHLSNSIIKAKAPGQIVDSGREDEIYRRYGKGLESESTQAKINRVVLAVLAASRLYPDEK